MIAALPMYDWPEVQDVWDRFWALIRDGFREEGIDAPDTLDREVGMWEAWESPDLLLGQTCGLPYRTRLHGKVAVLGTPDFGLPDAPGGYYYSQVVTRIDEPGDFADFADKVLAINGFDSQSGWGSMQNTAAAEGFGFSRIFVSGAHIESARAVAEGRADIAAIDGVSWRLLEEHRPKIASRLRIIRRTETTPGLPMITAPGNDAARMAHAVEHAIAALAPADRARIGLRGFETIPAEAYLAVRTPPLPDQIDQHG
ncbi:phosphate/phosphite/phosphonate ABC transporter substrate-binding protein [Ostreiculturibacter nitratireducens]|uniref:phosphate/phosphite/phosphonate ABC transporter substrate-binding protein n=1 Tax=Ostreiculturibacter nitratireducens TaxID=3075226 RepID=UPI0031B5B55F